MHCRMRNVRALRCKPDGWLPSWDSLTRLLQTLIVPEWPQSEQPPAEAGARITFRLDSAEPRKIHPEPRGGRAGEPDDCGDLACGEAVEAWGLVAKGVLRLRSSAIADS